MVKALLIDLARTLLFPKDKTYLGGINDLHKKLLAKPGYKLPDYFELNQDFLRYLKAIKDSFPLYMFTSETIQNDPAIKSDLLKLFSVIYSASEMGMSKSEPEAYKFIAKDLDLVPNEILFIDDSFDNIEAAKIAGMETIRYQDNGVIEKIAEVIDL